MLKLQLERDESEETVAHYTMGDGLEAMRRDNESSFYHFNHLGTALALTGADEAVTDTYRHDAWGVLLARTGSTVNPHTYVGRERYYGMPHADLYHLGFRDYAQRLGRFVTVDPARRTRNWSVYVHNRPQHLADALGLQGEGSNLGWCHRAWQFPRSWYQHIRDAFSLWSICWRFDFLDFIAQQKLMRLARCIVLTESGDDPTSSEPSEVPGRRDYGLFRIHDIHERGWENALGDRFCSSWFMPRQNLLFGINLMCEWLNRGSWDHPVSSLRSLYRVLRADKNLSDVNSCMACFGFGYDPIFGDWYPDPDRSRYWRPPVWHPPFPDGNRTEPPDPVWLW